MDGIDALWMADDEPERGDDAVVWLVSMLLLTASAWIMAHALMFVWGCVFC